jgi:ribonuclease HI
MKAITMTITISSICDEEVKFYCQNDSEIKSCYNMEKQSLKLHGDSEYLLILNKNRNQFLKIIKSTLTKKVFSGQKIHCVFINNFPFITEDSFQKFICVDQRFGNLNISVGASDDKSVVQLISDGAFSSESGKAGFGGVLIFPDGSREEYSESFITGASNLMELKAVVEGLKRLNDFSLIKIFTDSRFVIRGFSNWIHFWKHNGWRTAYGQSVKYSELWQEASEISIGKMLEFKWIKTHSGHREHDFCHRLARKAAGIE